MTRTITAILISLALIFSVGQLVAAPETPTKPSADTTKPVFPDEFSDLDEGVGTVTAGELDSTVSLQLEQARQRYLRALSLIEQKDTVLAAQEFEEAISILNELSTIPRIEDNVDFTDLVQSVIEDYETHVQSIDDLDENSSIFILRDRMFQAVDAPPSVERIAVAKPTPPAVVSTTQIELTYNEYVEKNIQFLAYDKGRKFMKKWLERTSRWFPTLNKIAAEEGMPPEIVYLAMMESGLNPNAMSWAKAVGMWQFIKSTGEMYDLEISLWIDERRDVEKATRASMHFLKDLYNELGDWQLALAAYNCGPGGVRRAKRRSGLDSGSFWDIREKLPRETRNYVPLYIATTLITMNREQYGFPDDSLTMLEPYVYETFVVNEPVNLSALASCAGVTLDSMKSLNPELIRACTPPGGAYKLKIPVGTQENFGRRFALLTDDEKRPWITHTVGRKETIAGIAKRYGVSASELASVNGVKGYKSRLRRGSSIRIPVYGATSSTTVAAIHPRADVKPTTPIATTEAQNSKPPSVKPVGTQSVHHVVRSGDNLSSIAQRYGVRLADLRNWNDISYDRETIRIGDTLVVSVTDRSRDVEPAVERIPVERIVKHTVARGESLASIATLYGTSVDRLQDLNSMNSRSTLKAGKTIRVETKLSKNELSNIDRSDDNTKPITHIVRRGESLGSISALYSVDESDLRRWNQDEVEGTTIFAGSRLKVYTSTSSKGSEPPAVSKKLPKTYKVRKGDTLSGIADKFGVSMEVLREKNPSVKNDNVRAGQRIRLQ